MKRLDRIFVCLYLAIAIMPYVATKLHWEDHPTWGRLPPSPRPHVTFQTVRDESYQKAYTTWFESKLGLKGYSIATDNSILYHVFGETKPGAPVLVGKHGVLFHMEDIGHYNKDGYWLPEPPRVATLADRIAAQQQRLRAEHRAFVPVIVPTKTAFYRDEIPALAKRSLGDPRPSDTRIYEAFKRALDERHVLYVDARAMMLASDQPRDVLWGADARHWSHYTACLVMRDVAQRYTELSGHAMPYSCALTYSASSIEQDDFDLLQLLNIWQLPALPPIVPAARHDPVQREAAPPSVLFVGTSFCWAILHDAELAGTFGAISLDYYDKTLISRPDDHRTPVEADTPRPQADLIVLDLFEGYLLAPSDSYVETYLGAVERQAM